MMPPFASRLAIVQQALAEDGIDVLVVFSPEHVYYLAGFDPGHSPASLLIPAKGKSIAVVAQSELAGRKSDALEVVGYFDDTLERPCDVAQELCHVVASTLKNLPLPRQQIAFEDASVPSGMIAGCGHLKMADMTPLLMRQRRVKDAFEMEEIRAAVALVDSGQDFAFNAARFGLTELYLFGATQSAIQSTAGRPVTVQGDFLSGDRTLLMGGPATEKRLDRDDAVIVDLQACGGHYWADTTRTFTVGQPSDDFRRLFDIVAEALNRAIAAVAPGVPANEVDRAARDLIASQGHAAHFPHHTGHGCGLRYYEPPLIVPNNSEPLAEGMVLCLEPGIYVAGVGGVRLEQMVRVGASGPNVLSAAPLSLEGGQA